MSKLKRRGCNDPGVDGWMSLRFPNACPGARGGVSDVTTPPVPLSPTRKYFYTYKSSKMQTQFKLKSEQCLQYFKSRQPAIHWCNTGSNSIRRFSKLLQPGMWQRRPANRPAFKAVSRGSLRMLTYDVGKKAHLTASCQNLYQLHRDQIVLLINDLSLEYSAMVNQHKCASAQGFTVRHLDGTHVPDSKCNSETLSVRYVAHAPALHCRRRTARCIL